MENKDIRLIDANALLETICKKCPEYDCKPDATDTVSGCLIYDVIASAPTIDAQPVKRGKFEWEPGYVGTTAKCSVCGLSPMGFYSLPTIQIGRLPEYPFCPKCGARMEADEDGTRG